MPAEKKYTVDGVEMVDGGPVDAPIEVPPVDDGAEPDEES